MLFKFEKKLNFDLKIFMLSIYYIFNPKQWLMYSGNKIENTFFFTKKYLFPLRKKLKIKIKQKIV